MKIKAENLFLKARNAIIPIFPKNYRTVLALCSDPKVTSKKLSEVIIQDYGLTLKMLKMIYSAFYAIEKKDILSIRYIVVLLGIENIKSGLLKVTTLNTKERGLHILYMASGLFISQLAVNLSKKMGLNENKVLICGMLQNLGELFSSLSIPQIVSECLIPGSFIINKKRFIRLCGGYDPRGLGEDLAKFWNLPQLIRISINPKDFNLGALNKEDRTIVQLVFALNELIKFGLSNLSKSKLRLALSNLETTTNINLEQIEEIIFRTSLYMERSQPFFHYHLSNIGFFKRLGIG